MGDRAGGVISRELAGLLGDGELRGVRQGVRRLCERRRVDELAPEQHRQLGGEHRAALAQRARLVLVGVARSPQRRQQRVHHLRRARHAREQRLQVGVARVALREPLLDPQRKRCTPLGGDAACERRELHEYRLVGQRARGPPARGSDRRHPAAPLALAAGGEGAIADAPAAAAAARGAIGKGECEGAGGRRAERRALGDGACVGELEAPRRLAVERGKLKPLGLRQYAQAALLAT